MTDLDDELVARALQWCGDAGRQASADQVRAALAPLSWDQLLVARALLADPPPARPLGPWALADIARGALPDVAAQRERDGQYRRETHGPAEGADRSGAVAPPDATRKPDQPPTAPSRVRRRGSGIPRAAAGPVIRRARDRVEPAPAATPALPLIDELLDSEGRAVLERLLRAHGARRAQIVAALGEAWRRRDGAPAGDADLEQLLDVHGLTRAFQRRERDELLHALRAAGGVVVRAAARVGAAPAAFTAALERLGATADAERVRAVHRDEIRRRGTLSERVRLVLDDPERLSDLGVLAEIEADLRSRLPEHLRALRAAGAASLPDAVARTLSVPAREVGALLARLGIDTGSAPAPAPKARRPAGGGDRPVSRRSPAPRAGPPQAPRPASGGTHAGARRLDARGPTGSRGPTGVRRPAGSRGPAAPEGRAPARPGGGARPAAGVRPAGGAPGRRRPPPGRPSRSGSPRPTRGPGRRGPR